MKIDLLAHDGSQLQVTMKSIYGEDGTLGVGGAELSMLTLCEAWHSMGHEITVYNNPKNLNGSVFDQRPISKFNPEENRDILIVYRSPNRLAIGAKGKKIFWSHDQQTVGNFAEFSKHVDKILCNSQYHRKYFYDRYKISNTICMDLPVRLIDYPIDVINSTKVNNQFLFSSVPTRGLEILAQCWPKILHYVPDVTLVITSDFRLWGCQNPMNEEYRLEFAGMKGVKFLGGIKRRELCKVQMASDIHGYPCLYDELFCISVSESQACGVVPITSTIGALGTTNMRFQIEGNPKDKSWQDRFVTACVTIANQSQDAKREFREKLMAEARERFSLTRITKLWENEVFNG